MTKKSAPNVIIDKNSTYGKKPPVVITSQGTPEHNKDPKFTMSAHDKAELFIAKMKAESLKEKPKEKPKSKIQKAKQKLRGVKK